MNNEHHLLMASLLFPELDRSKCVAEFKAVPQEHWFHDPYRNTTMLPVMSMGGRGGPQGANNFRTKEPYEWVEYVPQTLRDWFETHIFPWMGMKTRISLLKTTPGQTNFVHIDCSPKAFNSQQHKFRIILQGRTDTLYFVSKLVPKLTIFNTKHPFIMDGSWPHGMDNFTNEEKYTIAVGAPWNGLEKYDNIVEAMYVNRDLHMPSDYETYFDPVYKIRN